MWVSAPLFVAALCATGAQAVRVGYVGWIYQHLPGCEFISFFILGSASLWSHSGISLCISGLIMRPSGRTLKTFAVFIRLRIVLEVLMAWVCVFQVCRKTFTRTSIGVPFSVMGTLSFIVSSSTKAHCGLSSPKFRYFFNHIISIAWFLCSKSSNFLPPLDFGICKVSVLIGAMVLSPHIKRLCLFISFCSTVFGILCTLWSPDASFIYTVPEPGAQYPDRFTFLGYVTVFRDSLISNWYDLRFLSSRLSSLERKVVVSSAKSCEFRRRAASGSIARSKRRHDIGSPCLTPLRALTVFMNSAGTP